MQALGTFFIMLPFIIFGYVLKGMFFIAKAIVDALMLAKAEKDLKKSLGTDVQQPMVSSRSNDVVLRVAMNLTTETLEYQPLTVVHCVFDFSDRAVQEINKKRLGNQSIVSYDPLNQYQLDRHKQLTGLEMSGDVPSGKVPLLISDILAAPRQKILYRNYNDAVAAMGTIKQSLVALKSVCEHGAEGPISEVFET